MNTLQDRTAVQILSHRVQSLEKALEGCREAGRQLSAQLLAVMDAQEKMGNPVKIRVPAVIKGNRCRSKLATYARFQLWRVMFENGMTEYEIANEYGVDRTSIRNARKQEWLPDYMRRK